VKVDIPKDIKVHTLGSGASSQSVFFVAEDDIVYAAGQNYRFQLGLGKIGSEKFPVLVEFDEGPSLHEIVKISSSGTHTVAISCELYTDMPTVSPTIEPSMHPTFEPYDFFCYKCLYYVYESFVFLFSHKSLTLCDFRSMHPTTSPSYAPTRLTEGPTQSPTESP